MSGCPRECCLESSVPAGQLNVSCCQHPSGTKMDAARLSWYSARVPPWSPPCVCNVKSLATQVSAEMPCP